MSRYRRYLNLNKLLGRERSGSYRHGSVMRAHQNAFAVLYDLEKYTDVS